MKILKNFILASALPLLAVTLWQALGELSEIDRMFLPLPSDVAITAIEMYTDGGLFSHLFASLKRVGLGFGLAFITAVPLGLLLGSQPLLYCLSRPLIEIFRTISPIAWVPLAILWLGIGDAPAVFIISLSAFFPLLTTTASANKLIRREYLQVAQNLGLRRMSLFCKILLPASLPSIFVGARIALGVSWMIIVAAEMVGMRSGLGYLILDGRNLLRSEAIISAMLIIGIVGLLMDSTMARLEHWSLNYQID